MRAAILLDWNRSLTACECGEGGKRLVQHYDTAYMAFFGAFDALKIKGATALCTGKGIKCLGACKMFSWYAVPYMPTLITTPKDSVARIERALARLKTWQLPLVLGAGIAEPFGIERLRAQRRKAAQVRQPRVRRYVSREG